MILDIEIVDDQDERGCTRMGGIQTGGMFALGVDIFVDMGIQPFCTRMLAYSKPYIPFLISIMT